MPAYAVGTESGKNTPAILTSRQKIQNIFNLSEIVMALLSRHFKEEEIIAGINLFPQNPPMTWQIINVAAGLRPEINLVNPSSGFTESRDLLKIAQASSPNLFSGTVDYLVNIFLPLAQEQGVKFGGNVVYLNGFTKMHPVQRQRVKEMFKSLGVNSVIALDGYSASELKESALIECEEKSGFHHLAPLSNIIRTVRINKLDPKSGYVHDWDFAREGEEGYAAIWNIDGAGTLLEGYLLGDRYERISYHRCPSCGLNVERIFNVSRAADQQARIKGVIVDLNTLREKILNIQQVREVQLVVEKGASSDRLVVRYIPADGGADKVEGEIRELFEAYSDVQPAAIEKASAADFYRDKKSTFTGILRT